MSRRTCMGIVFLPKTRRRRLSLYNVIILCITIYYTITLLCAAVRRPLVRRRRAPQNCNIFARVAMIRYRWGSCSPILDGNGWKYRSIGEKKGKGSRIIRIGAAVSFLYKHSADRHGLDTVPAANGVICEKNLGGTFPLKFYEGKIHCLHLPSL